MTIQKRFDVPSVNADAENLDARQSVIDAAGEVLGSDYPFSGKSLRAIRLAVIEQISPDRASRLTGKSDDYVEAAFDHTMALDWPKARADRAALGNLNATTARPDTSSADSPLEKAQAKADEEARAAYQAGAPACAQWRRD